MRKLLLILMTGFFCLSTLAQMQKTDGAPAKTRTIMAGDRLRISVSEAPEMTRVYAVAGDGSIDMDLVGRLIVGDLTDEQAEERIKAALESSYFKSATVLVEVAEFVEGAILVQGAVTTPGSILFKGDQILTLMEAIGQCGGLRSDADGQQVHILRWKSGGGLERQIITVDVRTMLDTLNFSQDQFLRPRDMVVVPFLGSTRGGGEFLALGEIQKTGFHPISGGMDVIRAITTVGGVTKFANMDAARLLRPEKNGKYKVIPLDLMRLFGAADVSVNVSVEAGDILFVPSTEQTSGGLVYLLGEVETRGAIPLPLEQETTVARLLLGRGGLGKFANTSKVKILRTAPDGSKQTLVVDVDRILRTGDFEDDVPLRDEDVIIVPEKLFSL